MSRERFSHAEVVTLADRVLAAHGLTPGPAGHDLAALAALADTQGWGHATERRHNTNDPRRWRATVFRRDAPRPLPWVASGATGLGHTDAEALAIALARMLARATGGWPPVDHPRSSIPDA